MSAPTPKQKLREHLDRMHGTRGLLLPQRSTLVQLQRWHANEHHRYHTSHYHAGVNLGPDQRPDGWYSGADAIPTDRRRIL